MLRHASTSEDSISIVQLRLYPGDTLMPLHSQQSDSESNSADPDSEQVIVMHLSIFNADRLEYVPLFQLKKKEKYATQNARRS
jgi:hypothetical protein